MFHNGGGGQYAETKSGSYVFSGDSAVFHEWEFRTKLRVIGQDGRDYKQAMSTVVEGLRGDAFIIAQEVGIDRLMHPGKKTRIWTQREDEEGEFIDGPDWETTPGVDLLVNAMKASVFPLTTNEAKEMFRQYCKQSGSLSRQRGESMHQYVSRRRRCWKLLKELDSGIE